MAFTSKIVKSAPVRKGVSFLQQLPRAIDRINAKKSDYLTNPPILVNSLPKSGTHLLMQVIRAIPGSRYYGSFIAQTPSITMHLRSQSKIDSLINKITPGEVLGAHLYYTENTAAIISKKNIFHLFIHRDPRDVIISEANYLAKMNRWHYLHRFFKKIPDKQGRIRLSIDGLNIPGYPSADKRFKSFLDWRKDPNCLLIRYEDLVNPDKLDYELSRIIDGYLSHGGQVEDTNLLKENMIKAIDPNKSHTFHKGGTGRWKSEMCEENKSRINELFPELPQ